MHLVNCWFVFLAMLLGCALASILSIGEFEESAVFGRYFGWEEIIMICISKFEYLKGRDGKGVSIVIKPYITYFFMYI